MILYHGGPVRVDRPEILSPVSGRSTDFGSGFYTTTSREQAVCWAQIRKIRDKNLFGFVSSFQVPDDILFNPALNVLLFRKPDSKWLRFVVKNRSAAPFDHGYDLVSGPVANDRVYTVVSLFEASLLDEATTIARLKTFVLADQILFHTEKALSFLIFLQSEVVP